MEDESHVELGMEAQQATAEHHSSAMMPWSRGPSLVPGSSIKGSAQKPDYAAPSPIISRDTVADSIERHSDVHFGSDDFGGALPFPVGGPEPMEGVELGNDTQSSDNVDIAGQRFLGYALAQANEVAAETDEQGHRWVDFEALASPEVHSKVIAAQAFLHVLTLATRNDIRVRQEVVGLEPFGRIEVGVDQALEVEAGE